MRVPSNPTGSNLIFRTGSTRVRSSINSREGAKQGAVQAVTTFTVDPGARVLWCLRRRASDVRCVVFVGPSVVEVRVLQERDLV